MILFSSKNRTHFCKKGFALCLVLKVSVFGTRKWPILSYSIDVSFYAVGTLVVINDETFFIFASAKASVDEKGRRKGHPKYH